jgi:uncharacterized protein
MPQPSSHSHQTSSNQLTNATLVVGASTQPWRYAFQAIHTLRQHGHQVYAYGKHAGHVAEVPIHTDRTQIPANEIDTVTLYVNPRRQHDLYDWLVALKPRRVIFNPGSENPELIPLLREHDIEPIGACTLVMLGTGQY